MCENKNIRILIVEDDRITAIDLRSLLEKAGYTVVGNVSTGEEALVKVKSLHPDLIFMDIRLQGKMDGIEAARAIQSQFSIPVIYLTAYVDKEILERVKITNPLAYITKPFQSDLILFAVEYHHMKHRMTQALQKSEERFRRFFEVSEEGILFIDNKKILDANPACEKLFGYSISELIGMSIDQLFPKLDHQFLKKCEREEIFFEHRAIQKDGSFFDAECCFRVFNKNGMTMHVLCVRDISRQKNIRQELQKKTAFLNMLIENIPDSIYFKDRESRFILASQAQAKKFGLSDAKEMIGKIDFEFFSEEHAQQAYKDEQEIIRTGKPLVGIVEKETWPDGHETWVITTKMPLRDEKGEIVGTFGISRDITWLKHLEMELKKERDRAKSYLDLAPFIFLVLNQDQTVEIINQKGCEILGYRAEEIIGKNWFDLCIPERLREADKAEFNLCMRGEHSVAGYFVHPVITRTGEERYIAWRDIVLRDDDGKVIGTLSSGEDITEKLQIEEEKEKLYQQLKDSLQEKSLLLAEIHHRVKNNLQIISSLLSLQAEQITDPRFQEIFQESQNRIRSMALVHEKLYESENFSSINFSDYILDLTSFLFQTYSKNLFDVELFTDIEPISVGIDLAVPCGLIINELVSNALKHAFPASFKPPGKIWVSLKQVEPGYYALSVKDNGVGLPDQIDVERSQSLGLKLVYVLAKGQLEGDVEISREQGTCFVIRFKAPNPPSVK